MRTQCIEPQPSPVGIVEDNQPRLNRSNHRRMLDLEFIKVLTPGIDCRTVIDGNGERIEASLFLGFFRI
jgi:hypothetical protein